MLMLKLATLTHTDARMPASVDITSSKGELCDMLETELLLAANSRVAGRYALHIILSLILIGNKTIRRGCVENKKRGEVSFS